MVSNYSKNNSCSKELVFEQLSEYRNEYGYQTYDATFKKQEDIAWSDLRGLRDKRKTREANQIKEMFATLYSNTRSIDLCDETFELTIENKLEAKCEFINHHVIKCDESEEYLGGFFDAKFDEVTALIHTKVKEASAQVINSLKEKIKLNVGVTTNELFSKLEDDEDWIYDPNQTDLDKLTQVILKDDNIHCYNDKFYFDDNETLDSWSEDALAMHAKMIRDKLKSFEVIVA